MWPMLSVHTFLPEVTNAMITEKENIDEWAIWVDWDKRVFSFQEAEGFDKIVYPTHDEMFRFAIDKSMSGFAIQ